MASEALLNVIDRQDFLEQASEAIQPAVTGAFEAAGPAGQEVKNFLHGTWLGHPLHPVLTDVPVGAWTAALALDAMETMSGRKELAAGADAAIAVGLVGALGSAVTGLTDWSATSGRARKVGMLHGLLNAGATVLYTTSLLMRRRKKRSAGVGLAMLGYAASSAAAYLGGHLVYGEQVGVDHTAAQEMPKEFVAVLDENELGEGELKKVEAKGVPVLLVRRGGEIHAVAHTCSHMGGPLSEGKLEGDVVQCPWHGSRFNVTDGSVVDGPATFPQPCFETRVRDGQIEVRSTR
ncbi:MAG TPA: Rieske 2Fe-2S domain-containing protein [Pyrinomonadaceae bacterium]|jgi:nitrite reductase/ring-hydroxylating ferredoxin subunit|nr:Rieske 2Fe-2S domain-containing protein [Pyrinomonadaceae bacterium]